MLSPSTKSSLGSQPPKKALRSDTTMMPSRIVMGNANTPTAVNSPHTRSTARMMSAMSMGTAIDTLHAANLTACLKLSAMEDGSPMRMLEDMSCLTE